MASDRQRHNSVKYNNQTDDMPEQVRAPKRKSASTSGEIRTAEPVVPKEKEHLRTNRNNLNKELTRKWAK